MKQTKTVFVVIGPTAGGKSAIGMRVAELLNGEIINADSMQVYRDLKILTACPSDEDLKKAPHRLYNFIDCQTQFDVAKWVDVASKAIQDVKNPVLVGGTGMYLSSIINGISQIPAVDLNIREKVRKMDVSEVLSLLTDFRFADPQRAKRALEVQLSSGKPITYWQSLPLKKVIEDVEFKTIFINPPREQLYERIAKRFHVMVEQGVVSEVEELLKKEPTNGVLKAIGVPEIKLLLGGKISKNQMVEECISSTRRYAKRQITWFKHQLKSDLILENISDFSLDFIKK